MVLMTIFPSITYIFVGRKQNMYSKERCSLLMSFGCGISKMVGPKQQDCQKSTYNRNNKTCKAVKVDFWQARHPTWRPQHQQCAATALPPLCSSPQNPGMTVILPVLPLILYKMKLWQRILLNVITLDTLIHIPHCKYLQEAQSLHKLQNLKGNTLQFLRTGKSLRYQRKIYFRH